MTYQVMTPKSVQKQIMALPSEIADRINTAILDLADESRPDGVTKMKGFDHTYRIRVGDYRIIYKIDDEELIIVIVRCKHRREVYREK